MKRDPRARRQMLAHCDEIHEDDGIDPRYDGRGDKPRGQQHRKVRQLCAQVADTLSLVLSGECNDEVLRNLQVVAVDPAPDTSRLMVTVQVFPPDESLDPSAVLERLARESGRLRCEMAAAITRRRTPKLAFQVVV